MKSRQVPAHAKCNDRVFAILKREALESTSPLVIRGYEIRIDNTLSDDIVELVDAHTIEPHRLIRLGSQFWWRGTLYVNPLDERLLP